MTIGGVLVDNDRRQDIIAILHDLQREFRRTELHCTNLNHNQLVRYSREVSRIRLKAFGVISRKGTLGSYAREIGHKSSSYYHKNVQYILERVGMCAAEYGIKQYEITVCIESGICELSKLKKYISLCRINPIYPDSKHLKHIDPERIITRSKQEEPLLQLCDLVAHSLYRCAERNQGNLGVTESRYLRELRSRFYSDRANKKVIGRGIKAVHSLDQLHLEEDIKAELETLTTE